MAKKKRKDAPPQLSAEDLSRAGRALVAQSEGRRATSRDAEALGRYNRHERSAGSRAALAISRYSYQRAVGISAGRLDRQVRELGLPIRAGQPVEILVVLRMLHDLIERRWGQLIAPEGEEWLGRAADSPRAKKWAAVHIMERAKLAGITRREKEGELVSIAEMRDLLTPALDRLRDLDTFVLEAAGAEAQAKYHGLLDALLQEIGEALADESEGE